MPDTLEVTLGPPEWDTGWTWPLNYVQSFFEEIWNKVTAVYWWFQGLWGFIVDRVREAINWVTTRTGWVVSVLTDMWAAIQRTVTEARDAINNWVSSARDTITGWLTTVYNWISTRISDLGSYLWGWLIWVKDRVVESVTNIWNWLRDHVTNVYNWLRDHVSAAWSAIVSWVTAARDWLWSGILNVWNWVRDWVTSARDTITAWITSARDWIAREIIDPWTDYVREVWDWLKVALSNLWARLREFLSDVWCSFLTNIAEPVYNGLVSAFTWIKDKFLEVVHTFLDHILGLERQYSPIRPEQATAVFGGLLAACAVGVGAIALINIGVEAIHPLKNLGMGHLSHIIYEFTSIGRVTGIFIGAILVAMLKVPAEYYYNKVFRPYIPTWAELEAMARKHQINREQFFAAMAYHGFSDEWIENIWWYMWSDPRLYDILRLADVATPEGLPTQPELIERLGRMGISASDRDWWLKMKFMLAGYEDVDVAALTQVVHKRETLEERTRYITQVRNMYHWGYWERDQALPALSYGGLGSAQIAYTLLAEDLWFAREVLDDRVLTWREAYRRDLLSLDQLRDNLLSVIPRRDRVAAIVELERIRKLPRPIVARPAPPKARYETPEGKARVTAALTLYRGALIGDETLRNRLAAEEMPTALVEATLALERARLAVKPVKAAPVEPAFYETAEGKLRVHTLRYLYRYRLLSPSELTEGLRDLEMPPTFAQAVLEDEDAYIAAHPPPPPPPAPPRYQTDEGRAKLARDKQAFRTGQIDEEELGRRLIDLEMGADMARWILDFEVLRREARAPAPPAPPPPYYKTEEGKAELRLVTERFRRGLLTPAKFYQALLDLEMTEGMAASVAEYEALRLAVPIVPAPAVPVPYYQTEEGRARLRLETERFRRGDISSREFASALLEMGMSEDQAAFIVEYEELRLS